PNRALFLDRLGLALSRLERRHSLAAVFFLDLDHFKVVNDSLGHSAGDQVLIAVAERLERSLRDGDTAARLGGDEFAVLCEDLVDDGELALFYQPEVRIADGAVVAAEALLRWRDGLGMSHPADFIPVAEETGLIVPIGEWVLREACGHLRRWRDEAPGRAPAVVSVNLSGRQLVRADLADLVAHALAESDLDPASLR